MNLFRINPTIRETNRYLSKTVDELLKKHGNVSNEEFEKELIAITGIGWKRVKDYKNHPKPGQRLKDNSLVVKYIRLCQKRDITRKVRFYISISICFLILGCFIYKYSTAPRTVESFAVYKVNEPLPPNHEKLKTKVFLEVGGWILRLGPIQYSRVPLEKFNCTKLQTGGLTNCSFIDNKPSGQLQIILLMTGDFVKRYSVMAYDESEIEAIRKQLSGRVDRTIASIDPRPLAQKKFMVDDETIDLMSNPSGPGSRAMLYISAYFTSL